ncbi:MAG: PH domain-containing protein [Myxococcota bacterium]
MTEPFTPPVAAPFASPESEKTLWEGRPAALDSLGRWTLAILTVGLAGLWWWIGRLSTRVRVTDQRVILKTGLFTLRTENFELYRVTDITVVEPFGERLLGFGRVVLLSSDRTEGHLELRGLRNVERLADQIRHAIEVQKQARRVATLADA